VKLGGGAPHAAAFSGARQMNIPILALLAFTVWTVAVLIAGVGVHRWSQILTGRAELRSFPGDEPHGPPAYRRIVRSHANCVENLPVFAALALSAAAVGAASATLDVLAVAVVAARIGQTSVHVASGSNRAIGVRFGFFAIQLACFLWMAALIARVALSPGLRPSG
jgi:uncharacterized MAPEG superfamily protein